MRADHSFLARIKGDFLEAVAVSPLGTPTIIGDIATNSVGMPNFSFIFVVFNASTAEPMTQLPSQVAQAVSIRFSAASQQSASTKGPDGLAQITQCFLMKNQHLPMFKKTRSEHNIACKFDWRLCNSFSKCSS